MITVYYTKVFPFLKEDAFLSHMDKMEEERRHKILQNRNPDSRGHSLAAGCLLHDALCERLGLSPESRIPFAIGYKEGGKPYLIQKPEIHFNLSHSGDFACCAIGDFPVGVDIQKRTEIKKGFAERFFTAADNGKLAKCREEERKELFFRMWSIKEGFMKLTGKGMGQGLASFEIDWKNNCILEKDGSIPAAYFYEQDLLPQYSLCVCAGEAGQEVMCKEIVY